MAKSYPHIDVRCNECYQLVRLPLVYETDEDRWNRIDNANDDARPQVQYDTTEAKGWDFRKGGRDFCPDCTEKFQHE